MHETPGWAREGSNLADPLEGAAVIAVSDEFFAPAKRLLSPQEPVFLADRFEEHGKWMDGWESRRRRVSGHDSCVIRIVPGVISGVDIDTRHFIGNYPAAASLDACQVEGDPDADCEWTEIMLPSPLGPDTHHYYPIASDASWTHLRLNIFPDGGVARLRVYGRAVEPGFELEGCQDLASHTVGGQAVYCNDMHFGHMDNLLAPHEPASMADGWETRRRREAGNDFVIVRLGQPGRIRRVEIDTAWFRGNYPAMAALRGADIGAADLDPERSEGWPLLLDPVALGPDQSHVFMRQLHALGRLSHVRMDIYPDGGVARLRLLGEPGG